MSTFAVYFVAGAALFALGFHALLVCRHLVRKILGMNVMGNGVFLIFIATAERNTVEIPDPVPQAMVLTGIVVAVCATAFALALAERVWAATGSFVLPGEGDEGGDDYA